MVAAVLIAVGVGLVAAKKSGVPSGASSSGGTSSFGPTGDRITLSPAPVGVPVRIARETALANLGHPPGGTPSLAAEVVPTRLAVVHVDGRGVAAYGSRVPDVNGRTYWATVYEVDFSGPHSCPGLPVQGPASSPPVYDHYYFAILTDVTNGQILTWTQDQTGKLQQECPSN